MKRAILLVGLCAALVCAGLCALGAGQPSLALEPDHQTAAAAAAAAPVVPAGDAALYIFDVSLKTLVPSRNIVIDNGKTVGELRRGHYLVLALAPGYHLFWLKYGPKGDKVHLQAAAGQTYYAAGGFQPVMPAAAGNATFAAISKQDADGYLAQMTPMPPLATAAAK